MTTRTALALAALLAAGDYLTDKLAQADARHASTIAGVYCERLGGCPGPLLISVEDRLPPRISAHTTLDESGTGCLLHFTKDSVSRNYTIAHEVCHCAHDHAALDHDGYRWTVPLAERTRREADAQACGDKLMEAR